MRRLAASFFGTGLLVHRLTGSHAGAGTVGAGFALAVSLFLDTPGRLLGLVVCLGLSLWSAGGFGDDPPWVVIDEAAGAFLATIGLASLPALIGWAVFRVADIAKRVFPGVAAAERLPGAVGVTADDLVAGLYGLGAGWLVQSLG